MKKMFIVASMVLGLAGVSTSSAQAGCVTGAVVGGVVGHIAGRHGGVGAAAGCAIGHHNKVQKQKKAQDAAPK